MWIPHSFLSKPTQRPDAGVLAVADRAGCTARSRSTGSPATEAGSAARRCPRRTPRGPAGSRRRAGSPSPGRSWRPSGRWRSRAASARPRGAARWPTPRTRVSACFSGATLRISQHCTGSQLCIRSPNSASCSGTVRRGVTSTTVSGSRRATSSRVAMVSGKWYPVSMKSTSTPGMHLRDHVRQNGFGHAAGDRQPRAELLDGPLDHLLGRCALERAAALLGERAQLGDGPQPRLRDGSGHVSASSSARCAHRAKVSSASRSAVHRRTTRST